MLASVCKARAIIYILSIYTYVHTHTGKYTHAQIYMYINTRTMRGRYIILLFIYRERLDMYIYTVKGILSTKIHAYLYKN